MSSGETTLDASVLRESPPAASGRSGLLVAVGLITIAGLGLFWWQFVQLWVLWTTDSLRSIGAFAVPAAIILAIRELRREDFASGGSWWGLGFIALAMAGAGVQYYGSPLLFLSRDAELHLLPTGLSLYLYASGVTVLFGGARAWRKAGFALFLLLFVNPVPAFFTSMVDLPLQRLGAEAARSFAALLGVPVSGAALKLMFFHDELGMFIAPGCNGLHGAVAMGVLALVIGHLRRMRMLPHLLFVAGAIALAYVFNLLRLCALVLYYCLAHLFPVLGGCAVAADYMIGGTLFVLAAGFLFGVGR